MNTPDLAQIRLKLMSATAKPPTKGYDGDAGYDLFADEDVCIAPGHHCSVRLGVATEFQEGYVALLWDRSGMGLRGIHRFAGVIDATYRGEWRVVLFNSTPADYHIKQGDKIVQVLFQMVASPMVQIVDELWGSARGAGGFGSTGK